MHVYHDGRYDIYGKPTVNCLFGGQCRDLELVSSLASRSEIAGVYFSQTSVICFYGGFSYCPFYRGVRYSPSGGRGTPNFKWQGWSKDFWGFECFDFGTFLGGKILAGSQNPDPISDQKCHFSNPFSGLVPKKKCHHYLEREVQRLLQSWFKATCIVFYNNISAGHTSLLQVYRCFWTYVAITILYRWRMSQ